MKAPAVLRLLNLQPNERDLLFRAVAAFFCLLAGYYILRPVREAMGLTGGVRELRWLFLITMACMLLANVLFGFVVGRISRKKLLPAVYSFFACNLVLFYAGFLVAEQESTNAIWLARTFFIWVSVYNLFVVSVFWSLMDDAFTVIDSKRIFGLIAAGGSAGALLGAGVTALLVEQIGEIQLLPISIIFLLLAGALLAFTPTSSSKHLRTTPALRDNRTDSSEADEPVKGPPWSGVPRLLRSPYMLAVCAYILFYTITSTILYFEQAELVSSALSNRTAQTAFFARVDFLANLLAFLLQAFVAGRLMSKAGVGLTLAVLPLITTLGFLALHLEPTLVMIAIVQITRRASNYAFARPARETLFTVLDRQDKYKAKNLIDTFVYRGGDALGVVAKFAILAIPISFIWIALAFGLGAWQTRRTIRRHIAADVKPTLNR